MRKSRIVGGNREVIRHGDNGLLVRAFSAVELANAVKYLLNDADEQRRMGVKARQRVAEDFNIDHSMAAMTAVLLGASAVGAHAVERESVGIAGVR